MKNFKYTLSYDECDITEEEVKYRLEENEENLTEEEIRGRVYNDYDLLQTSWEGFKECLTEELNKINKNNIFKVKGVNMDWRNLEGSKVLKAENAEELLNGILPKTNEFNLYVNTFKSQMVIKCSHHDSPTGEFYYIKPLNKQEFNQYEKDQI